SDPGAGLRWQERILPFWQRNVAPLITEHGLANMAADKAAAVAGGWLPGLTPRLRWPYRSASPELVGRIATAARAELPEFFTA
ncbi:MAG: dihydrodipicolinate synthase family protein, partial [Verrucomicrobia bacterium]|nr:dihydrodipicolinate synthase family protein [Verrucomicrobiota bacterium]